MQIARRAPYVCNTCRIDRALAIKRLGGQYGFRLQSTTTTDRRPLRMAVIGSGPAGYYTAYKIMKKMPEAYIDMFESLPVPYGLVRFGVAPDHPEVKKSAETLEDVAKWPNFNFIGNVSIGNEPGKLPLSAIAPHYDGMLFAYGASKDKKLGVPGEDLNGVVSARAFVGWYNGLPEYEHLNPPLEAGDTAVVIGQGNVALDVARVLLAPLDELRKTDISEQALEALSKSKVRDVKVIGRRGPLQAPYTNKEIRELMDLRGVAFVPPPESWDELIRIERKRLPRQLKRIAEYLERGSKTSIEQAVKAWQLGYMRSPAEFLSSDGQNLNAVGFQKNEFVVEPMTVLPVEDTPPLQGPPKALENIRALKVRGTGRKGLVSTSLAFRSVGYESEALSGFEELGIPFDPNFGIIPNDMHGRVLAASRGPAGPLTAGHVPGMYCAGWVKRGPTGVIASTLQDAFSTAEIIVEDWANHVKFHGRVQDEAKGGYEAVKKEMASRNIRSVSWADWEKIDAEEKRRGAAKGKPREKFKSIDEMLQVLDS